MSISLSLKWKVEAVISNESEGGDWLRWGDVRIGWGEPGGEWTEKLQNEVDGTKKGADSTA